MNQHATIEKVLSLSKRRGFVYPSSEIYGGLANTWDFGPYGTQLKNNVRDFWWQTFIAKRDDMVGLDASIILNPKVWQASGHTASFADVMVEDTVNRKRFRADHLIEEFYEKKGKEIKVDGMTPEQLEEIIVTEKIKSPDGNLLGKPRRFNQLFETRIGILEDSKSQAFLRGEIAQGIFMNFKNVLDSVRVKIPFGIAQQGKAFRNEITMGKFIHRTLEFDLMEFEYFFNPDGVQWEELYAYWEKEMWEFALALGLNPDNLRWREHEEFERSHYSKMTKDIEYDFPFGFKEMFGLAYRTDFDLRNHMENSGKDLTYTDPKTNKKFIPHVIEPTFGHSRLIGILLFDAYTEEPVKDDVRTVLKLAPKLAPVKAAVFPLQKDDKLQELARRVHGRLKEAVTYVEYDNSGNIGKMYRRQDEIGTPLCVTVDYDSLENNTVTIRDRDSMKQDRVSIDALVPFVQEKIA